MFFVSSFVGLSSGLTLGFLSSSAGDLHFAFAPGIAFCFVVLVVVIFAKNGQRGDTIHSESVCLGFLPGTLNHGTCQRHHGTRHPVDYPIELRTPARYSACRT